MGDFAIAIGIQWRWCSSDVSTVVYQVLGNAVPARILSAGVIVIHTAKLELHPVAKIQIETGLQQRLLNARRVGVIAVRIL